MQRLQGQWEWQRVRCGEAGAIWGVPRPGSTAAQAQHGQYQPQEGHNRPETSGSSSSRVEQSEQHAYHKLPARFSSISSSVGACAEVYRSSPAFHCSSYSQARPGRYLQPERNRNPGSAHASTQAAYLGRLGAEQRHHRHHKAGSAEAALAAVRLGKALLSRWGLNTWPRYGTIWTQSAKQGSLQATQVRAGNEGRREGAAAQHCSTAPLAGSAAGSAAAAAAGGARLASSSTHLHWVQAVPCVANALHCNHVHALNLQQRRGQVTGMARAVGLCSCCSMLHRTPTKLARPATLLACYPTSSQRSVHTAYSGQRQALIERWCRAPVPGSTLDTSTVQAPQPPSPHPSLAPVRPRSVDERCVEQVSEKGCPGTAADMS